MRPEKHTAIIYLMLLRSKSHTSTTTPAYDGINFTNATINMMRFIYYKNIMQTKYKEVVN
jgi:hypothetical protein